MTDKSSVEVIVVKPRKCGLRKDHSLYLTGGTGRSEDGVLQPFTLVDPPILYDVPLHRGPRVVDALAILERQPMENWWMGSSLETEERKGYQVWEQETFGMPLSERLKIGACV